jgi:hypothetical protein
VANDNAALAEEEKMLDSQTNVSEQEGGDWLGQPPSYAPAWPSAEEAEMSLKDSSPAKNPEA